MITEKEQKQITSVNLRQLADFIEKEVPPEKLNMRHFRSTKKGKRKDYFSIADCGTCGCALGWAPFVWKPIESEILCYKGERVTLMFEPYARRIFPAIFKTHTRKKQWHDCFSPRNSSDKQDVLNSLRSVAKDLSE